jgi:hypothetical protein
MMTRTPWIIVFTFFLLLCGSNIFAWTQKTTPDGVGLYWSGNCFEWAFHYGGTGEVIDKWSSVDCSHMEFIETSMSSCPCDGIEVDSEERYRNIFLWCEYVPPEYEQDHSLGVEAIAYEETGVILNSTSWLYENRFISAYGEEETPAVIHNHIMQFVGNALGFGESDEPESVMHHSSLADTTKRDLHEDDILGLCTLYPAEDDPGICNVPEHALQLCPVDSAGCSCGCTMAGSGSREPGFLAYVLLPVLIALSITRRKLRKRLPGQRHVPAASTRRPEFLPAD